MIQRSLDGDQQTVDLKRQLQVVETEASILRTKTQNLETENEKLLSENKKLSLIAASKTRSSSVERTLSESKLATLEKQLEESNKKVLLMCYNFIKVTYSHFLVINKETEFDQSIHPFNFIFFNTQFMASCWWL